MSIPFPDRPVYWLEADEEVRLVAPKTKDTIARRSLLAYILLRLKVVGHPADFWQSANSHKLIFDANVQPILQSVMQIHLGDSPTVVDYMADRLAKLKKDKASSKSSAVELQQYTKYGTALATQGAQLDGIFYGATFPASGSRDAKFRELIREDLASSMPFGPHLSRWIREGLDRQDADKMIGKLLELAHDRRRFISIDGVTSRLTDARCHAPSVNKAHHRLQVLHWESRSTGHVSMPFLSKAKGIKLDPADPDVFWTAVDGLLGVALQETLMSLPWHTAMKTAHELRTDGVWEKFIETYEAIVAVVERDHDEVVEAFVKSRVLKDHPNFFGILIGTKPDVWSILSWTCHVGSWCAGIPDGMGLAFRIGSGVATVKKIYDHARKVVSSYHTSDRHLLTSRIRKMLDEVKEK